MRIIRFATARPVTVFMATLAAAVFGLVALGRLDLRLLPEIRYPSLTVQTDFPNTAPVDVENLVTRPLEEAVGVVPGLREVHSISQAGLSQITLEFDWDSEMDYAALEVREKIDLVSLPEETAPPVLLKYDPALDPVLRIGLSGEARLVALRNVADDVLKKEIEALRGVAAARVSGGLEEEIQVEVDEARLAALGVSIGEVNRALAEENVNASGGRLRDRNAEYLVRTLSRFTHLDDVADVTVAVRDGKAIRLADVAQVRRGHKERTTITHVNGRESVEIAVFKEGDENIVAVSERVRRHLDRVREQLPEGMEAEVLFDQSVFIGQAIREVRNNAILGGLLAILVLYVFLRDLRSTVIIALAIPISIVTTFILMYTRGVSLNIMSLGGLALGVGMLVDNSIVVLESIFRRRERAGGAAGGAAGGGDETGESQVVRGAGEVAGAVIASTLTTVAVFVPIVFVVQGVAGQIFQDQALTVTFSLFVSLVVSLTFTPMVAVIGRRARPRDPDAGGAVAVTTWRDLVRDGRGPHWLRSLGPRLFVGVPVAMLAGSGRAARAVGRLLARLVHPLNRLFERTFPRAEAAYEGLLAGALRHRGFVFLAVAALMVTSAGLFRTLGTELIPPLAQGEFTLVLELPEGTPLGRTDHVIGRLGREIRTIDGIASVSANVGVSREGETSVSRRKENRAEMHVKLASATSEAEESALAAIREKLDDRPGISMKLRRPSLFTFSTPVEVDVYGYELTTLMTTADRVAEELAAVRGVRDIRVAMLPGSPEIRVSFDRDKLNRLGLRLSEVATTVQGKVRGTVASRFRDQEKHIDIRVQNDTDQRSTLTAIEDLIVAEREGIPIKLASVAGFEIVEGPSEIHRLGSRRVAIVTANLAGRDLGSVTADLERRLTSIPLPANTSVELGGQNEEMQSSFRSLRMAILLAVFLVYLVMAAQFESFLYPFIIMFTVPLALMGAVLGLRLTGTPLSVIAAIGAIMLAGIVVNNGIVLVDRVNQLRRRRVELFAAVRQAGRERFRPILMTTATTVLGLTPMALGLGEGAELRAPLAITVISGLLLATLLTLLVVPVAYTLLTPGSRDPAERRAENGAREPGTLGALPAGAGPGSEA